MFELAIVPPYPLFLFGLFIGGSVYWKSSPYVVFIWFHISRNVHQVLNISIFVFFGKFSHPWGPRERERGREPKLEIKNPKC
jgi:hypothetical protein